MITRLKSVFASFERHDAKYVVIGGVAAVLYGVPRATFDLDILIEATPANAQALLNALRDAGLGSADLTTAEDIVNNAITIFEDRVHLDVMTRIPGLEFAAAWENRNTLNYQGQQFYVLSKSDLITSKKAKGRPIDLEDVRLLSESLD